MLFAGQIKWEQIHLKCRSLLGGSVKGFKLQVPANSRLQDELQGPQCKEDLASCAAKRPAVLFCGQNFAPGFFSLQKYDRKDNLHYSGSSFFWQEPWVQKVDSEAIAKEFNFLALKIPAASLKGASQSTAPEHCGNKSRQKQNRRSEANQWTEI